MEKPDDVNTIQDLPAEGTVLSVEEIEHLKPFFEYLEDLRLSGATNMFGAAPWMQEEFDIDIKMARRLLTLWMRNYDEIVKQLSLS